MRAPRYLLSWLSLHNSWLKQRADADPIRSEYRRAQISRPRGAAASSVHCRPRWWSTCRRGRTPWRTMRTVSSCVAHVELCVCMVSCVMVSRVCAWSAVCAHGKRFMRMDRCDGAMSACSMVMSACSMPAGPEGSLQPVARRQVSSPRRNHALHLAASHARCLAASHA